MNYLAHFFLAHPEEPLMFGNFIGDGVKGSDFAHLPEEISRGVRFHRFIDSYTDLHPEVLEAKKIFYPTQSKFSGVVVDVLFDHLLALDWDLYHTEGLDDFAQSCYRVISVYDQWLPKRSERFFVYMVSNNILSNYASIQGIERVFKGMDSRTKFSSNMLNAAHMNEDELELLRGHFQRFFPELVDVCDTWKKEN